MIASGPRRSIPDRSRHYRSRGEPGRGGAGLVVEPIDPEASAMAMLLRRITAICFEGLTGTNSHLVTYPMAITYRRVPFGNLRD